MGFTTNALALEAWGDGGGLTGWQPSFKGFSAHVGTGTPEIFSDTPLQISPLSLSVSPSPRPPGSCLTHLYLGVTEVAAPLCFLSVPPSKDFITNKGIPFPACSNHHLPPSGEL